MEASEHHVRFLNAVESLCVVYLTGECCCWMMRSIEPAEASVDQSEPTIHVPIANWGDTLQRELKPNSTEHWLVQPKSGKAVGPTERVGTSLGWCLQPGHFCAWILRAEEDL